MTDVANADDMKALGRIARIIQTFRGQVDANVSLGLIDVFLRVAMNEGRSPSDMLHEVGINKTTLSRYLLDMSGTLRGGEKGYGLLQRLPDPTNLRAVRYTLTPKGHILKNLLVSLIND